MNSEPTKSYCVWCGAELKVDEEIMIQFGNEINCLKCYDTHKGQCAALTAKEARNADT